MEENNVILSTINILNTAEINLYLIKFNAKSKKLENAVILPDDINKSILEDYAKYLYGFKDRVVAKYNPTGNKEDTLPVLGLSAVEKRWNLIIESINNARSLCKNDTAELNKDSLSYGDEELNLIVVEIKDTTEEKYSYFISRYQSVQKILKFKKIFFEEHGKLEEKELVKTFTLNWNIDVLITNDNLYVLSETRFNLIFDYDESLKEETMKIIDSNIKKWKIFSNIDNFIERLSYKYAYRGIAKICKDTAYLNAIEKFDTAELKDRILQKGSNLFTEEDFENGLLKVTEKNAKNIINLISKELKYNIFEDKVEIWKIC